jgi:hypothetical protein
MIECTGKIRFGRCRDKLEDNITINLKEWEIKEKREFGTYWYGF